MAFEWVVTQDVNGAMEDDVTIIEKLEIDSGSGSVTVTPDPVLGLPVSITGYVVNMPDGKYLPPQVQISASADTLTIQAPNFAGMFPFYVKSVNRQTLEETRVDNAFDIPSTDKPFEYYKDANTPIIITISITATDETNTETKDFKLIIFAEYTANKLTLESLVNQTEEV